MELQKVNSQTSTLQFFSEEIEEELKIKCPSCNEECLSGDNFCGYCGQAIYKKDISSYLTHREKEKYLRKYATVMFADLQPLGFYVEDLSNKELEKLVSPLIEIMLSNVYRYNGTVIHVTSNGIVIVFGAPESKENHAECAALAALAIQKEIGEYTKNVEKVFTVRVGINSGEVFLELLDKTKGAQARYDITGRAVNLAARMEQIAKPSTIQITRSTQTLIANISETQYIGQGHPKGFKEPIDIFLLNKVKSQQEAATLAKRSFFFPFIGREEEMDLLNRQLQRAKSGDGSSVGIVAEAGRGKSRLIYEFINANPNKPHHCLVAGAPSQMEKAPLEPIIALFKNLFEISSEDSEAQIQKKIAPYIKSIDTEHAESAALMLVDMTSKEKSWEMLDSKLKIKKIFYVGGEILNIYSRKTPTIVLLEDLHWIDHDTEAFLAYLIDKIDEMHLLLLTTYRDYYIPPWEGKSECFFSKALKEFSAKNQDDVLDIILGNDISLQALKKKIKKKCAGNPFFLQETVLLLINEKKISGNIGDFRFDPSLNVEEIDLPDTIHSLLQVQLEKLDPSEKDVMETISVNGEETSYTLLRSVIDFDEKASEPQNILRTSINHLVEVQYIFEILSAQEGRFNCKHALIQEVVYTNLLRSKRKILHRKILHFMENKDESSSSYLLSLAQHAYLGEDWGKAYEYCLKAGKKVAWINLPLSIKFFEQALQAATHIDVAEKEPWLQAYIQLVEMCMLLGIFDKMKTYIDEGIALSSKHSAITVLCIIYSFKTVFECSSNQIQEALNSGEKAVALSRQVEDQGIFHSVTTLISILYLMVGDYKNVQARLLSLIDSISDLYIPLRGGITKVAFLCLWRLGFAIMQTGDFFKLEKIKNRYLSTLNIDSCTEASTLFCSAFGFAKSYQGEFEEADYYLKKAFYYGVELEVFYIVPVIQAGLGYNTILLGNIENGCKHLEKAITQAQKMHYGSYCSIAMNLAIEGFLHAKKYEKVKELTSEMLPFYKEKGFKGLEAWLQRIDAECDLLLPNADTSNIKKTLENALKIFSELEMKTQEAHAYIALAKLYAYTNQKEEMASMQQSAIALYDQLNMPFWKAEALKLQ